jgi:ERCC4-type nuclease
MEKKILIDSNEASMVPDIVERIKKLGIPVGIEHLDCGDYVIGDILVERKTIDDWYSSLNSGRLWDQLYKMKLSGKKCIIAIVGIVPYIYKELSDISQVLKRISQMRLLCFRSYGVLLLQFQLLDEFISLIEYCWTKMDSESYAPVIKKEIKIEDVKVNMLGAIKSLGPKRAKFLAIKYKISDLCNMTVKDLENIEVNNRKLGVAGKNIFEVLHS